MNDSQDPLHPHVEALLEEAALLCLDVECALLDVVELVLDVLSRQQELAAQRNPPDVQVDYEVKAAAEWRLIARRPARRAKWSGANGQTPPYLAQRPELLDEDLP